jgi:hypothetical protein
MLSMEPKNISESRVEGDVVTDQTAQVDGVEVGRVVHIKKDPYDVYIGRSGKGTTSKWGNPYRIGDPHPETGEPIKRGEAIPLFKEHAVGGAGRHLLKDIGELDGKTLGCFCAPKGGVGSPVAHDALVCHGQILLMLVEWRRRVIQKKREEKRKGKEKRQREYREARKERKEARSHNRAVNTGREKIAENARRNSRAKEIPVHRFHDDHEPTALFYCGSCQPFHPTLLIHDGAAPAGTQCDDCDVTNAPPDPPTGIKLSQIPRRYIFCGSREWDETVAIREKLQSLPLGAIVVVGGARRADRIAERVARRLNMRVEVYKPNWDEGKGAGFKRNEKMLGLPKVAGVCAFRVHGKSNGTDHMVRISREAGVPTEVNLPAKSPIEVLE